MQEVAIRSLSSTGPQQEVINGRRLQLQLLLLPAEFPFKPRLHPDPTRTPVMRITGNGSCLGRQRPAPLDLISPHPGLLPHLETQDLSNTVPAGFPSTFVAAAEGGKAAFTNFMIPMGRELAARRGDKVPRHAPGRLGSQDLLRHSIPSPGLVCLPLCHCVTWVQRILTEQPRGKSATARYQDGTCHRPQSLGPAPTPSNGGQCLA